MGGDLESRPQEKDFIQQEAITISRRKGTERREQRCQLPRLQQTKKSTSIMSILHCGYAILHFVVRSSLTEFADIMTFWKAQAEHKKELNLSENERPPLEELSKDGISPSEVGVFAKENESERVKESSRQDAQQGSHQVSAP
jgi:hypothetical protein